MLDVRLPVVNRRAVCARIKANPETCHVPVLVMSGIDAARARERACAAGADAFLTKPFSPGEFPRKAEELHAGAAGAAPFLHAARQPTGVMVGGQQDRAMAATCRVLVVDDDPIIREAVRDALELGGYAVATAADGGEGLDRIAADRPQVVLLDMRMPKLDGWEFARRLREHGPAPRPVIIVMTAAPDARAWAREIAADAHLAKPFDLDEMLRLVARCCAVAHLPHPPGSP